MEKIAFLYSEEYLKHGHAGHVEKPERIVEVFRRIEKDLVSERLFPVSPRKALLSEIELAHDKRYFPWMKERCENNEEWLDPDTYCSPQSPDIALLATGGVLNTLDSILLGKAKRAFCLVRPPGHHAESQKAMGFCLLNHVAIAARYAKKTKGVKKVLVFDWDAHHGNGTQEIFYADPAVMYQSIHQSPLYPGTGMSDEIGSGEGEGFTVNVPVFPTSGDKVLLAAFEEIFKPVILQFKPELILVSAGYDPHWSDPITNLKVTTDGFGLISRKMMEIADEVCGGKVLGVLEGGYNLDWLPPSVLATLRVWSGDEAKTSKEKIEDELEVKEVLPVFQSVRKRLQPYWEF